MLLLSSCLPLTSQCCRYHWALIVGPNIEDSDARGKRYHVRDALLANRQVQWTMVEQEIPLVATQMLLARVVVGKVTDKEHLRYILRSVPVIQENDAWTCVTWVEHALEALRADGRALGTSILDWDTVGDAAIGYVQQKKDQGRYDGSRPGVFDMGKAATFDLLLGREIVA